ncbi:MAG: hypothetical protein AAF821_26930 [Cyanobacteria bacterium P01_D01_bin.156]
MLPEERLSQNFSISNSPLSNVQIGGQAGGDLQVTQSQQIAQGNATQELSSSDVSELLSQLIRILTTTPTLSEGQKEKAIQRLEATQDEINSEEPDKDFAAKSLQRATKLLKDAGETVETGTSFWTKIEPIIEKLAPWFGAGLSFFI